MAFEQGVGRRVRAKVPALPVSITVQVTAKGDKVQMVGWRRWTVFGMVRGGERGAEVRI
jgi:hypothetical protein